MYLPWLHSGVMRSREKCTTPKPVGHSLWCNARAQKGRHSHSPQHQQKAACEPTWGGLGPAAKKVKPTPDKNKPKTQLCFWQWGRHRTCKRDAGHNVQNGKKRQLLEPEALRLADLHKMGGPLKSGGHPAWEVHIGANKNSKQKSWESKCLMIQQYQTSKGHLLHFGGQISMPNSNLPLILTIFHWPSSLRLSVTETSSEAVLSPRKSDTLFKPWWRAIFRSPKRVACLLPSCYWLNYQDICLMLLIKSKVFEVYFPTVEISVPQGDKWWVFSPQTNIFQKG